MNYEAVYRTAPATPGLLKILKFTTKNVKLRQQFIYNKTAYVQSKIFTPVLKFFTQPLVAMVVTFSMSEEEWEGEEK